MLLFIIGTRPELIKIAPLIKELKRRNYKSFQLINTGQHRELLDIYWKVFGIVPDFNLDIILPNQDLSSLTARAIDRLNHLVKQIISEKGKPDFIISQGDTTTVFAASVVAFYHQIDFAHVEAGLRSFDLFQPFPEEFNRRVASITAKLHFAPTVLAKQNLILENIHEDRIKVVGNTGIDALKIISDSPELLHHSFKDNRLNEIVKTRTRKVVLITCHRRENHDRNLLNIIEGVSILAKKNREYCFVWPVHANPKVKEVVLASDLIAIDNVFLTEPLDYVEIVKLLSLTCRVLTDSGGLQEEAPSFKIPVLILRDKTERPEAVNAGYSKLVGSDVKTIVESFENFNPVFVDDFQNPYGDGMTSYRIVETLLAPSSK